MELPKYEITENVLTIYDSHRISKFRLMGVLKDIKTEAPWSKVWKRCMFSLYCETICHDFLYMIGYQRERTGTVDLDYPCDHPEWLYIIGGIIVWPFTFKTK